MSALPSVSEVNATSSPSGAQAGSEPFASRAGSPPSVSTMKICVIPVRSDWKTTCVPSGDTDGARSIPGSSVRRRASELVPNELTSFV